MVYKDIWLVFIFCNSQEIEIEKSEWRAVLMENVVKKVRAVIYCRMATDNDSGQGLEMQKEKLCRYAEQQDYDIVGIVAEVAKGNNFNRPGLQEIYNLARNHSIDKVLAVSIDRFGRNLEAVMCLENKLKRQHVRLDTPQGNPLLDYRKMVRSFQYGRKA